MILAPVLYAIKRDALVRVNCLSGTPWLRLGLSSLAPCDGID